MLESQFPSMQHLPRKCLPVFSAVKLVAEDGMTKVMKVHAHLMSPSAVQFAFKQTHLVARA